MKMILVLKKRLKKWFNVMIQYNIGDVVRVKDTSSFYSNYTEMFVKMNFKNHKENYPIIPSDIMNTEFEIFGKETHPTSGLYIYGIRDLNNKNNEYLSGPTPFKLIRINNKLDTNNSLSRLIDSDPILKKEFKEAMTKIFNKAIKSDAAKKYWISFKKSKYHK